MRVNSKILQCTHLFLANKRCFGVSAKNNYQITVVGAAGGIGQPLSMLFKINPLVTKLHLYDISPVTPGVAVDISHIETPSLVKGFTGPDQLCTALKGADIVVMPAGLPRKPGMTREDLFNKNAGVVKNVMENVAKAAPNALIAIITNPVNSVVPIACETLKKAGTLNPKKVFGVTTLDTVRANTFLAELMKMSPFEVKVPVIGGHSGITIIPLLSKITPQMCIPIDQVKASTARIQDAGTEVVKAKGGAGSATLSMAYAGARFTNSLLRGLSGEENVVESAYVMSNVTEATYFATPLVLGKCGLEKNLGVEELNDFEKDLLQKALCELKKHIEAGIKYANQKEECAEKKKN